MQILINSLNSTGLAQLFLSKEKAVFHGVELILAPARHWLIYHLLKLTWLNQLRAVTVLQEILLHEKKIDAPPFFKAALYPLCSEEVVCSTKVNRTWQGHQLSKWYALLQNKTFFFLLLFFRCSYPPRKKPEIYSGHKYPQPGFQ